MKKVGIILLTAAVLLSAAACTKQQSAKSVETFELALVTDLGTIDDRSFNQGSWDGLEKYAKEKRITHRYYQPKEKSTESYLTAIELAVKGGAKLVVTPGFPFEVPVFIAQDKYPAVHFILLDGVPHSEDYQTFKTGKNVVAVLYAEDQAGFLAGYAAVKDGNRKLGFMGGLSVPAVVRFGYGFIQGAEYAGQELGLGAGAITVNYHYTGGFSATPEVQAMSASWYNSGVEIIFGCGGAVGNSVMAAAEMAGKKVIGVDVDQSGESPSVITSAMKGLTPTVYSCITDFYKGQFPGGQTLVFDASNDGVGLPMETSVFKSFKKSDYDAIHKKLSDGSIPRMENLAEDGSPRIVPVRIVKVTEVK